MTAVLGVRFQRHGTLHLLGQDARQSYSVGDAVLYPTEGGPAVAEVAWVGEVAAGAELPLCMGAASAADLDRDAADRRYRAEVSAVARELIARHGLAMKVLAVDYERPANGQPLAVVYYQSPGRVDFRSLLVDLGRVLQCRLDLRQVGDRDAARLIGDLGCCGRPTCCTTCLRTLDPVPARAGRAALAGVLGPCGRPMCCLRREEPEVPEDAS